MDLLYNKLNKHLNWYESLSIMLVINKIRPAYLCNFSQNKINKISKIIKDIVFYKLIEFKPKKFFTLFYLDSQKINVDKYSKNPKNRELLGKILGYSCPWKNNRTPSSITYTYTIEIINNTGEFNDIITYVCDKQLKSYEKQQYKQAVMIKNLIKHITIDYKNYSVVTKITKNTVL